jgi:hypothetical protein
MKLLSANALADARTKIDSLPSLVDAVAKLPGIMRDLPAAPVIMGAASRMVADAIAHELTRRGPSPGFLSVAQAAGLDDLTANQLHEQLVAELGR